LLPSLRETKLFFVVYILAISAVLEFRGVEMNFRRLALINLDELIGG